MKLELKNLKVHAAMSEETTCFSATLYVDGKKAAAVRNNGRGGCHAYYWEDFALGDRVREWAKTQPTEFKFDKLDQLVDALINRLETLRSITRNTRKKTWFRLKEDKKGEWRVVDAPYTPAVRDHIVKQYGDRIEVIANEYLEAAIDHC